MEFFFLKTELRNRIIKRLERKIKINDWIVMILALTGALTAVLAVRNYHFHMFSYRAITTKCLRVDQLLKMI